MPTNWIDEINKFLKTLKLPKLNQEGIENLNRSVTSKETEWIIIIKIKLLTKKSSGPDDFIGKFYQT